MASSLEGPVTRRRARKAKSANIGQEGEQSAAKRNGPAPPPRSPAADDDDDSKDSPSPAATAAARRGRPKAKRRKEQLHPKFRSDPNESPRQISTSLFLAGILLIVSVFWSGNDDGGSGDVGSGDASGSNAMPNIRPAVLATFLSFLTFSYLQTRDLILTFPHPGFWRLVFGAAAFYALCMVALLQLDRDHARGVVHAVFPDIGTQEEFDDGLRTRIDAVMGTCQLSTAALARQLFHCPWVLAHALGWMVKMLIFRDYGMAFFAAVVFEVMEVTLMHAVPEFEECWWDSLFLDTLGANLLGMYLGDRLNQWIGYVQRKRQRRRQKLGGDEDDSEQSGAVVSALTNRAQGGGSNGVDGSQQVSVKTELGLDFDWAGLTLGSPVAASYQWKVFSSLKRLLQLVAAAFFMSLLELNSFLLINAFGVANNVSWFVLFRLVSIGLLGIPFGAEIYEYVTQCDRVGDNAVVRLGPSSWLLFCTAMVEVAVSYKFFPRHMSIELARAGNVIGLPYNVLVPHLISISLLMVWVVLKYKVCSNSKENSSRESASRPWVLQWLPISLQKRLQMFESIDGLLIFASVPIAFLFYMGWKWD